MLQHLRSVKPVPILDMNYNVVKKLPYNKTLNNYPELTDCYRFSNTSNSNIPRISLTYSDVNPENEMELSLENTGININYNTKLDYYAEVDFMIDSVTAMPDIIKLTTEDNKIVFKNENILLSIIIEEAALKLKLSYLSYYGIKIHNIIGYNGSSKIKNATIIDKRIPLTGRVIKSIADRNPAMGMDVRDCVFSENKFETIGSATSDPYSRYGSLSSKDGFYWEEEGFSSASASTYNILNFHGNLYVRLNQYLYRNGSQVTNGVDSTSKLYAPESAKYMLAITSSTGRGHPISYHASNSTTTMYVDKFYDEGIQAISFGLSNNKLIWIIVTSSYQYYYSYNGLEWIEHTMTFSDTDVTLDITYIKYINCIWFAKTYNRTKQEYKLYYSYDGFNWEQTIGYSIPSISEIDCINNIFITQKFEYSYNGIEWFKPNDEIQTILSSVVSGTRTISNFIRIKDKIAVFINVPKKSPQLYYSYNGKDWINAEIDYSITKYVSTSMPSKIVYYKGTIVACGGSNRHVSSGGSYPLVIELFEDNRYRATGLTNLNDDSDSNNNTTDIQVFKHNTNTYYLAINNNRIYYCNKENLYNHDGWSLVPTPEITDTETEAYPSKISIINNIVFIYGENSKVYYSTDCISWNELTSLSSNNTSLITQINDKLYCCGINDFYSDNGITWTKLNLNGYITYINNTYITYNSNGLYISEDGINFREALTGYYINNCIYGNNKYIICTDNGILSSTDLITFTESNITGCNINNCVHANNLYMVVVPDGSNGKPYYSYDGDNWTIGQGVANCPMTHCEYIDNKWIAFGSYLHLSDDGINWTYNTQYQIINLIACNNYKNTKIYYFDHKNNKTAIYMSDDSFANITALLGHTSVMIAYNNYATTYPNGPTNKLKYIDNKIFICSQRGLFVLLEPYKLPKHNNNIGRLQ